MAAIRMTAGSTGWIPARDIRMAGQRQAIDIGHAQSPGAPGADGLILLFQLPQPGMLKQERFIAIRLNRIGQYIN